MQQDKRRARQALQNFKRMLALEPGHTGHLEQLARLSAELGDLRQAARYHLQRAEALEQRSEPAAALASVRAALECDPHHQRAREMLDRLGEATPADEILVPRGGDGLLPVNDALLATDDPLLDGDDLLLADDAFSRENFLPSARQPRRRSRRPSAIDDLSAVAERLRAGLGRIPEDTPPARPAPIADRPTTPRSRPGDSNELVADLAEVEVPDNAVTRDFTIERVEAALADDATGDYRAEPSAFEPSLIELDESVELLTSNEFEFISGSFDGPASFDVSADQVLEVRAATGPLPQLPRHGDGSLDGSTANFHRDEIEENTGEFDRPPPLSNEPAEPLSSLEADYRETLDARGGRTVEVRVAGRRLALEALFDSLPREVLDRLIARSKVRTVRIGTPLVKAGDRFAAPVVIMRGQIVRVREVDGRVGRLPPLGEGALVGAVELVWGGRWRTTLRAERETEVLELPVRWVDEARGDHPEFEQQLREIARLHLAEAMLAGSVLFGGAAAETRGAIGHRFRVRMFGPGEPLLTAGASVDGLYLVIAGEVDVEQDDAFLTTLSEGDFVGVVAALQTQPSTVRAVAATPVEAFYLDPRSLRTALEVPEVRQAFSSVYQRRRSLLDGGRF